MAQIFEIPPINPIKLYKQSDIFGPAIAGFNAFNAFDPNINDKGMDSDFFYRNLRSWMTKRNYWQPYQQGDSITLQWVGLDDEAGPTITYVVRILDCNGTVVKSANASSTAVGSSYIREVEIPLYDVLEGKYFVQIQNLSLLTNYDFWVISEGIEVKQYHANTSLIKYSNTSNDQGIFWETGLIMQKRIHAYMKVNPDAKFNVYEDQPLNLQMLSGVPFREWILSIGVDSKPFPPYELDILNRVFLCDTLQIDNTLYTLNEGAKFEVQQADKFPLMTANIAMREKVNNQDLVIVNYEPIVMGNAPTAEWFFVKQLDQTTPGTVYPISKYFHGAINFVNYLNTSQAYDDSHYAIDSQGRIVFITTDATKYADFQPGYTFSTPYTGHLILELETVTGQTDLVIAISNAALSTKRAYFYGDGTAVSEGTAVSNTTTKVYAANGKYTAYLFWDLAEDVALDASDLIIKTIAGKLPPKNIVFTALNNVITRIKNNLFDKTFYSGTAYLTSVDLSGNNLQTGNVNELLMWFYEALKAGALDTPGGADISGNTPAAPPSADAGLGLFKGNLTAAGFTVTTD